MNDNQATTKVGTETATASESTKKLLSAVKRAAKSIDIDADELNDELNSVMDSVDPEEVDCDALRAMVLKHLRKQAVKMTDEIVASIQMVYGL